MRYFKRVLIYVMAAVMVISLAACSLNIFQKPGQQDSKDNIITPPPDQTDTGNSGNEDTTPAPVPQYSNQKYSWGFVRGKDHLPPEIYKKYADLVDKYNGIYLGDTTKKVIYLTFDEGYENGYTPAILDTLKANDVKAAFFITSPYLKKSFDLVKRMMDEGHIVANHTVNHPSMPEVTDDQKLEDELLGLDRLFYEKTGKTMKYIRPPKGEFSERTLAIAKQLGYRSVFWSFAYADWDVTKQPGKDNAKQMVLDNLHNGAVLLLHAVSQSNTEALDEILKEAKAQGYTFDTLDNFKK